MEGKGSSAGTLGGDKLSPEGAKFANVAARLSAMAEQLPEAIAVVEPLARGWRAKRQYRQITFRELDQDSSRIAAGLRSLGAAPGMRLVVLVRPGIDFVALVFALFKAGVVAVLIDPGMGRRNLIGCLAQVEPDGFVALPVVQAVRTLLRRRFPKARFNVTVGRRWFWGGMTLEGLRAAPDRSWEPAPTKADDPAAIIFTSGSTGPPKGVLYSHGNFDAQVEEIRDFYGIKPGEIDLPCFPLLGLFNCAMGVTAVIPDMDASRPARVDPKRIVEAITDWKVTQTFGSPAIWDRVGWYCQERRIRLDSVRSVLSAGAPVPARVLERMRACIHPQGEVHTPYGTTESLPLASIAATEVLQDTVVTTRAGGGVCVGRKFPRIQWKVIRIVEGPIRFLGEAEELAAGDIGELIVFGPVVTREYVTRTEMNPLAKIGTGAAVWHRTGDAGYLDAQGRFWFCGRVVHRVLAENGPMYTIRCEAIFNQHPDVCRSALVGVGPPGHQRPVIVLEPWKGRMPRTRWARENLLAEIRRLGQANPLTTAIRDFLLHRAFPVDVRHNVKIARERLAVWAAQKIGVQP